MFKRSALGSSDYVFSYDVWPGLDATSKIAGSGEFDRATQGCRYTRQSDPADPSADQSTNGQWIMAGGGFYFNDGSGQQSAGPDSTYMPLLGTGSFDIWITPSETGYERIIIELIAADGRTDRVIFTEIGEEVSIEAPQ